MKVSNWYAVGLIICGMIAFFGEILLLIYIPTGEAYRLAVFGLGMIGLVLILALRLSMHMKYCDRHGIQSLED